MLKTNLVQRLKAPPPPGNEVLRKLSRVFGGGNLGLTEEAYNLIQQAFDFDYMGAAEYEFGDVQRSLHNIVQHATDYALAEFTIDAADIKPGWWRERAVVALRAGFA